MTFPMPWFMPSAGLPDIILVGVDTEIVSSNNTEAKTLPGSPLEGDLVLVLGSNDNSSGNAPAPDDGTANYTEIRTDTSAAPDCGAWYKILGASPESTVNLNGFNSGANETAFVVAVFRNVDSSTPLDVTTVQASNSTGDPNPPSITTVTAKCAIVSCGFLDDDKITSCTQSGGSDVTFLTSNSTGSSATMIGWQIKASAGAVDPATFVTDGDDEWVAYSIALRPG